MTIEMKKFGKYLITRQDAQDILQSVDLHDIPVLNFSGVEVANHPFLDELVKGIAAHFPLGAISTIKVEEANSYTQHCVSAGFSTAFAV
jgi:hypothetical protein